jgi:hypothetical protein
VDALVSSRAEHITPVRGGTKRRGLASSGGHVSYYAVAGRKAHEKVVVARSSHCVVAENRILLVRMVVSFGLAVVCVGPESPCGASPTAEVWQRGARCGGGAKTRGGRRR